MVLLRLEAWVDRTLHSYPDSWRRPLQGELCDEGLCFQRLRYLS